MPEERLLELEREGWQALSTSPEAATEFYERVLDREVEMLLPGGLRLTDRAQIVASMGGAPWDSFKLHDLRTTLLGEQAGLVTYAVEAVRAGDRYSALVASLYVKREGGWRMTCHQQTPS